METSRITNIKDKIEKIISRFTEILQESPVEVLISLFTFILPKIFDTVFLCHCFLPSHSL